MKLNVFDLLKSG